MAEALILLNNQPVGVCTFPGDRPGKLVTVRAIFYLPTLKTKIDGWRTNPYSVIISENFELLVTSDPPGRYEQYEVLDFPNACVTDETMVVDDLQFRAIRSGQRRHVGINTHRLTDNPQEAALAKAWQDEHAYGRGHGILPYLLSNDDGPVVPTERDEAVAATVIQWLGSPVGVSFLKKVGYVKED